MDNRPIGIFDSGIGGLTVARALQQQLPNESFLYIGDTARAPYGNLSTETLLTYSHEIVGFLLQQNVKAIVLACGTTSSTVFDTLRADYPHVPMIDVVRPGVAACAALAAEKPGTRLGFIATAATVKRGLFAQLLKEAAPGVNITSRACPLFAPIAEQGLFNGKLTRWAANIYLAPWKNEVDVLVLGCTHYPLLAEVIAEVLPVPLINLSESTAAVVATHLTESNTQRLAKAPPMHKYFSSGPEKNFSTLAEKIVNHPVTVHAFTP